MMVQEGYQLSIFIRGCDQKDDMPLYKWLLLEARKQGIAGATVLRGVDGFGTSGEIRRVGIFDSTKQLPIVIEMVDVQERIENFTRFAEEVITTGVLAIKKVKMRFFGKN